ncbi:MAG: hypothetical protein IPJ19_12495 [Planctomycetes bacterium]|nr:hypothetical protein [Planctomycetota bacterium]
MRTTMNGLLGTTELLADTPLSLEQRELVRTVQSSGGALLGVVHDIVSTSRVPLGYARCSPEF